MSEYANVSTVLIQAWYLHTKLQMLMIFLYLIILLCCNYPASISL